MYYYYFVQNLIIFAPENCTIKLSRMYKLSYMKIYDLLYRILFTV